MDEKIFANTEELIRLIKYLEMYKKEEDIIYDNINNYYEEINKHYKSSNTNELDVLQSEIITNINNNIKNHNNNIYNINKHINESLQLERKTIDLLSNKN